MHATFESQARRQPPPYDSLPKNIGEVPPWQLLSVAKSSAQRAENLDKDIAAQLHATAGSAYVEAALIANDQDVDERLHHLDLAEAHLQAAADGEEILLERGFYDTENPTGWLRAQLNLSFIDVYRDIACGEVTPRTTDEIIQKLRSHKGYLEDAVSSGAIRTKRGRKYINGLRNELVVLLQTWENYALGGSAIAFPSTKRGGNGNYRPEDTHDVVFAWQNNEENWDFSGAEIKSGRGRTVEALTRYKNMLIFVGPDESVKIFEPLAA